ncbi:MAG: L-rhamnose mutarotase [Shimia sp.]|uniref:L-rhamnose mutarotase n=1 Tax=Shimia sp. TaxID=1954381 RepID=UPI004059B951
MVQRMGMVIGISPENIAEYTELHANVWPEVLARLKESNISNYSIFLREPENLLFSYWEYSGSDFEADMAAVASHEVTQKWWALCGPMQRPLETKAEDEWWATMEPVFHLS